jgi:hypothetical protein
MPILQTEAGKWHVSLLECAGDFALPAHLAFSINPLGASL